jgi:hypothetical protein
MIVSSSVPLHAMSAALFGSSPDAPLHLEMWSRPDVITVRLHAWSAGFEDKPTVVDYGVPLVHMLPTLRRRFATQLAGAGGLFVFEDEPLDPLADSQAATSSPPVSPCAVSPVTAAAAAATAAASASAAPSSTGLLGSLRSKRKGTNAQSLLPEITLRLVDGGGRSFWLTTAHSLVDQGCTPANSSKSILEVHQVRPEMLQMPKQVDPHLIVIRGELTVRSFGRTGAPLAKERVMCCVLIDHFLFLQKKASDKAAEAVILLEYHTLHAGPPLELRRQHVAYSPAAARSWTLSCASAIETRRWYEALARQCLSGEARVFGAPLKDVLAREKTAVPAVVSQCIDYLRVGVRLNCEGLFRKTGHRALLEFARDQFDAGGAVDLNQVPRIDEEAVAALLKTYFSELPEPIIPFALYGAAMATEGVTERVISFVKGELPTMNLEVLHALCRLLKDTAARSSHNKMTAKSLGIIFGPTLLRQRHGELDDERLVADITVCSRFCQVLIERAEQLAPGLDRATIHADHIGAVEVEWASEVGDDARQSIDFADLDAMIDSTPTV